MSTEDWGVSGGIKLEESILAAFNCDSLGIVLALLAVHTYLCLSAGAVCGRRDPSENKGPQVFGYLEIARWLFGASTGMDGCEP